MKINEIAMRHKWNDDLGSRIREVIHSNYSDDEKALSILKSIEQEYYNNDDLVGREQIAKNRIAKELPNEFSTYLLKYK
jgi:hypothetical protein